jgi:hypothetical protein
MTNNHGRRSSFYKTSATSQVEFDRAASIVHLICDKACRRGKSANLKTRKPLSEIPEIRLKPENTALLGGWRRLSEIVGNYRKFDLGCTP